MRSLRSILTLILLISSVYVPFLGSRLVRSAGDEKVYVSQALEMARDHHWFVQTLQDEPNYYKGPFHYILLRVGMLIFGHSPWAVVYMNYFLILAGALALAAVFRRRIPEWRGGDVWIGAAFAFGTGIYAHASASQMEVELASLFAVGTWLLDSLEAKDAGWAFWCVTGVIGWIKSPLHSAFLGASALLFSALQGNLTARLKNPHAWAAVVLGISVCIAGYLPAYFLDRQNFWDAYVLRETLRKSDGSGQDWSVAVVSTFGFYLFPWMLLALSCYVQTLFQGFRIWHARNGDYRRLLALGFSIFLPSVLFFIWHVYRFENYNLPVIAGVWIWIGTIWAWSQANAQQENSRFARLWLRLHASALGLTGVLFLAVPALVTLLVVHFSPMPTWWPGWLLPLSWAGGFFSAFGFLYFGLWKRGQKPVALAISSAGFLWALGALLVVLGEREMIDLRTYLSQARPQRVGYYNLNHNIWSEWGLLTFWMDYPIAGIHSPEKLKEALERGDTILVTSKENSVEDFKAFVAKNEPALKLRYIPWKRWRTRGQSDSGKPLWREAWDRKDLSLLEVDYFIVEPLR